MNNPLQPVSLPNGSDLCLSCGFCSRGVLHLYAALEADEIPLAHELGMEVVPRSYGQAFRLPCPRFIDGKCSTYEHRPRVCPGYKCQLLRRYLRGEVTLERAQALVRTGEELMAAIETSLRARAAGRPLWQQLELWCVDARHPSASGVESAESLTLIGRLAAHLQQHFERRHTSNPMYAYVYWTVVSQMVPRETLESIVGRAVINVEFRQALHADPRAALAGYGLPEEAQIYVSAALDSVALDSVSLETLGGTLAARVVMRTSD
jgi:hypothetical protein